MQRFPGWGLALAVCIGAMGSSERCVFGALLDNSELRSVVGAEEARGELPAAIDLDSNLVFEEVSVGPGGTLLTNETGDVAGAGESRLIYSNTLGIHAINFPANQPVSDDIATTAPDGCRLNSFKFKVLGKVLPTGVSGPFTVKYALYENCPWAMGSGSTGTQLRELIKIPETSGEISFPDDSPRTIKHVIDPHQPVAIPANVYLGLQFNRNNCGTVIGSPATVGYSGDILDYPNFPCNGFLGGFPQLPHASFWVEMYGEATCPDSYPGYKCARASGPTALIGANIQGVDDIKLQVKDCLMVGYEVTVRGVGFYTFDLRRECDGSVIAGTTRTFSVNASTLPQLQLARFTFSPPIALTNDELYFGFKSSSNTGGAVIAGIQPIIGSSDSDYYVLGLEGCTPVLPTTGVHGSVNLAITCAGSLPIGACCDMAILECQGGSEPGKRCLSNSDCGEGTCESVCRELPEMNCPWPPIGMAWNPAWAEGAQCNPDPFELPCGVAACCKPDDTCENLTKNECAAVEPPDRPRLWQQGMYCGQVGQACPFNACLAREGNCLVLHDWPGCSDPFCCADVCSVDPWCCHVEWDRMCLDLASEICRNPPVNDECGPILRPYPGAIELTQSIPFFGNNTPATSRGEDPGFCCNAADPGSQGEGTVWFKFIAIAETAQIDTCASASEGDTLINVFSVGDPTDGLTSCQTLALIGCGDNGGCPSDESGFQSPHTRFCVEGLTIGETYYIELASKMLENKGTYEIQVKMPCQYLTPFSSDDCNGNGIIDGCDLVVRTSRDCDLDGKLDQCEDDPITQPDCDGDGVPDTCDSFWQRLVSDPPSEMFGRGLTMLDDVLLVGDQSFPGTYEGIVRSYERDAEGWKRSTDLINPDPSRYTHFGLDVAGSGTSILILSIDSNSDDQINGRVFAFQRKQQQWVSESFPNLTSDDGTNRILRTLTIDGELAAVKTECTGGPPNCGKDVIVHIFRRAGSQWRFDGALPVDGSFDGRGFSMALRDSVIAVTSKGMFPAPSDQTSTVLVFQKQGSQWVMTDQDLLGVEEPASISMHNTLMVVAGSSMQWWTGNQVYSFSFFRRIHGHWTDAGTQVTDIHVSGYPPIVTFLSPITLAMTVSNPLGCPSAMVLQRTSYWSDTYGAWAPLTHLQLTHCGPEQRSLSLVTGADHVALGIWGDSPIGESLQPGSVQIFAVPPTDCDDNGEPDACQIQGGLLADCNFDSAPDICQARGTFDLDFDLNTTLRDFAWLQNCTNGMTVPSLCCEVFDNATPLGIDVLDLRGFVYEMHGP